MLASIIFIAVVVPIIMGGTNQQLQGESIMFVHDGRTVKEYKTELAEDFAGGKTVFNSFRYNGTKQGLVYAEYQRRNGSQWNHYYYMNSPSWKRCFVVTTGQPSLFSKWCEKTDGTSKEITVGEGKYSLKLLKTKLIGPPKDKHDLFCTVDGIPVLRHQWDVNNFSFNLFKSMSHTITTPSSQFNLPGLCLKSSPTTATRRRIRLPSPFSVTGYSR